MANPKARLSHGTLAASLISTGIFLVAAAIVGGAVEGAGFKLPAVNSLTRQLLLALLGVILTMVGLSSKWIPLVASTWHRLTDPHPPSAVALFPPDPIRHFVGRDEELAKLHTDLRDSQRVAVTGLSGIGKTQLAAWYCRRYADQYAHIFWISGDDTATLNGQFAAVAWRLELPQRELHDQKRVIDSVVRWMRDNGDWLLVVDDLDEKVRLSLDQLLGPGLRGHVLVTSRHPMFVARLLLDPLPVQVAADFIIQRTGQSDSEAAWAVADKLGCLPLALEQASAYLNQTGERLGTYAKQLDSSMGRLLSDGRVDSSLSSVETTWTLSFRRVARESSASADLLRLCAFLAPDSIPLDLIERSAGELKRSPKLQRALRDRLELNSIVWVLLRYSLVKRQGDSLSIHRLVQAVVRELLPSSAKRRWAGTAVRILAAAMPVESWSVLNWPTCERILPHVLTTADHALDCQCEQGNASSLLSRAGAYLVSRGEFSLAQRLVERALSVREHTLGPDHLQTATSLSNLGAVLLVQGELATAKGYLERALAIRASTLEPDDPVVANSFSNLGLVLLAQGNLTDAKQHFEQALAIAERVLGPHHPATALTLNNLGQVLEDQGDLVHARQCLERAMWLRERVLGKDDLSMASSLNDMGLLLQAEGDLGRAVTHMERALDICERVVGARYPDLATIFNNLGTVRQARGDLATARIYYERALDFRERLFGLDHLTTAGSLNNLGALLALQGGLVAARPYLERALAAFERVAGPDHPYTAASLNNMGALLQAEGRLANARTYYERGLAICQRILTHDHPYTAACRENLRALPQAGIELAPRGYYLIDADDGSMKPRVALIGSHLNYIEASGPTQRSLSGISGARVVRAAGRVGSWGRGIRTQVQRHVVKRQ